MTKSDEQLKKEHTEEIVAEYMLQLKNRVTPTMRSDQKYIDAIRIAQIALTTGAEMMFNKIVGD